MIHVIVACSENRVIGRNGALPWRIPEDMAFFQQQTAGQICVLGRVGYQSWPRAALDGRRPIVLTSQPLPWIAATANAPNFHPPVSVQSLRAALTVAEKLPGEIYVCGGQRIFEETLALPRSLRLHLTVIHAEVPGDRFFPEWRDGSWREISRRESSDENFRYTFLTLER
ncbi:MAG: Dihydrofolate reductase [Verrucomicrobiota bacterium]